MTNSNINKETIKYYMNRPKENYDEYIIEGKSTYQLAEEWGLSKSTVYSILKKQGFIGIKLKDKISYCNESKFNIENPIFCYMAGLISADGYIQEQYHRVIIRMCIDAKDVLEKLREYFEISSDVAEYITNGYIDNVKMYNLTISSKKLIEELKKLNIRGRKKDLLVRFPDMKMLSEENKEMFIRGLWDGDGTAYTNKRTTNILEESELMIIAINDFLSNDLGLNTCIDVIDNKYYKVNICDVESFKRFINWMYNYNLDIKIEYKYKRYFNNL